MLSVLPQLLAAWLATDMPCYVETRPVAVTGAGFTAGRPFRVTREGALAGGGIVDDLGRVSTTVGAGKLPQGVAERVSELSASDGTVVATVRLRVTRFTASFAPRAARPSSLVRFSAFGFGQATTIYLHYLRPAGGVATTVRLGAAQGACGTIARTRPRPLFPLRAEPGAWRLQFDTSRDYQAGAVPRLVLPVRVG